MSVAKIVQYLKSRSSKKLQEEFVHLKKKFWEQHMWATGSIGTVTNERIKEYIENQDKDVKDIFNDVGML